MVEEKERRSSRGANECEVTTWGRSWAKGHPAPTKLQPGNAPQQEGAVKHPNLILPSTKDAFCPREESNQIFLRVKSSSFGGSLGTVTSRPCSMCTSGCIFPDLFFPLHFLATEAALVAPEDPTASSSSVFVLLEQVAVGGPGSCAVLAGSVQDDLSSPAFTVMTKDQSGLGWGIPFLAGKLPKALNPPCASLSSSKGILEGDNPRAPLQGWVGMMSFVLGSFPVPPGGIPVLACDRGRRAVTLQLSWNRNPSLSVNNGITTACAGEFGVRVWGGAVVTFGMAGVQRL